MANIFSKLFGNKTEQTNKELENQAVQNEEKFNTTVEGQPIEEYLVEDQAQEIWPEGSAEEVEDVTVEQDVKEDESVQEESEENTTLEYVEKPQGLFGRLKEGLSKTRSGIKDKVNGVLANFRKIDDELFEELEEVLITSDMGVGTTQNIIEDLKNKVKLRNITDAQEIKALLKEELDELLHDNNAELELSTSPAVIVIVGVNGVGKTTSIGKIAHMLKSSGKKVLIAAADTFRAAAIDQLEVWGKRAGVEVIKHQEGADPGAVVFDAIQAAKARKADVVICDTAGRLHNKKNLMDELGKVERIINRELPESVKETLLVLDATTGQNAVQQAKTFNETTKLTGVVLTKLDGTAKGGIIVAIKSDLNIPVKFIGVGEGMNDLQKFNSQDFVNALFED